MSPAPVQMRPRAIVYPNHLTKFSRGGNGFIKLLGIMMLAFQFAAVSRLKSLTAGALKCMCLRTRWLAEESILPDKISLSRLVRIFLGMFF